MKEIQKYCCYCTLFLGFMVSVNITYFMAELLDIGLRVELQDEGCQVIKGVRGAEDQVVWNEKAVIMGQVDFYPLMKNFSTHDTGIGAIFVMNTESNEIKKLPIMNWNADDSLVPHGMDLDLTQGILYVINHNFKKSDERIELFKVHTDTNDVPEKLEHLQSLRSDGFTKRVYGSTNAIVVVAPYQFYITQLIPRPLVPHGEPFTYGKLQVLHESLVKRKSNVYYCHYEEENGLRCRVAAAGFMTANGITKNKNGTQIFVADTIAKTLLIFNRNTTSNGLKTSDVLNIGHSLDNLKYDPVSDAIYTGSLFKLKEAKRVDSLYPEPNPEDRGGVIELKSYTE